MRPLERNRELLLELGFTSCARATGLEGKIARGKAESRAPAYVEHPIDGYLASATACWGDAQRLAALLEEIRAELNAIRYSARAEVHAEVRTLLALARELDATFEEAWPVALTTVPFGNVLKALR